MMGLSIGATADGAINAYLRPETATTTYVNFKNVLDACPHKLPFGIAQIGKAFRNEISPRGFVFRMREFEQAEMQYFETTFENVERPNETEKNSHQKFGGTATNLVRGCTVFVQ